MNGFENEEFAYFEEDFYDEEKAFFGKEYDADDPYTDDEEKTEEEEWDEDAFADEESRAEERDFFHFVTEQYLRRKQTRVYLLDPLRYTDAQKSIRRLTRLVLGEDPDAVTFSEYDRKIGTSLLFCVMTDGLTLFGIPEFEEEIRDLGTVNVTALSDGRVLLCFSYANVRQWLPDDDVCLL